MFLRNGQIDIAFRYAGCGHGSAILAAVAGVYHQYRLRGDRFRRDHRLVPMRGKTHTTAATKAIAPQITAAVLFFINTITAQHPFRVNICALIQSYSIILGGILESPVPYSFAAA